MAVRINQSPIELVTLANPNVRIDQSPIEFVILPVPPSLTCGNPPPGQTNVFYTHAFPVTGGRMPFVFSIAAGTLPPGLALNTATGVVSGTPTAGGTFPFTLNVIDANLNGSSVQCSIVIIGGIKITLRGVKRVRCTPEDDFPTTLEDAPKLPSVDRAV
jgi:large repetitive protein